jgi:hypothetical protein
MCLINFNTTNSLSLLIGKAQLTKCSPVFTSTCVKFKAIYPSYTIDYKISPILDNRKVMIIFSLSLFSRLLHVKLSRVIVDKNVFSQMSIRRKVKLSWNIHISLREVDWNRTPWCFLVSYIVLKHCLNCKLAETLFVSIPRYHIYSSVRVNYLSSLISLHHILHFHFQTIRKLARAQILILRVGLMQLTVFLLVNIEHRVE